MSDLKRHIEIDRYLNNEMPPQEKEAFQNLLETDLDLRSDVELVELANQVIVDAEVLRLKAKMQNIHLENNQGQGWKIWGLGLLLLLAVGIGSWMLMDQPQDLPLEESKPSIVPVAEPQEKNQSTTFDSIVESLEKKAPTTEKNTFAKAIGIKDSVLPIDTVVAQNETTYVVNDQPHPPKIIFGSFDSIQEDKTDSVALPKPVVVDVSPCEHMATFTTGYRLEAPCFGVELGQIEMNQYLDGLTLDWFSIDGGVTYQAENTFFNVPIGKYELLAKNAEGCETEPIPIELSYSDCNFPVQPSRGMFWETELPNSEVYPLQLEIRNARTGALVFDQTFGFPERFTWRGTHRSGSTLPMGNYVYLFLSQEHGLLAKGQVTVIE